MKPDAMRPVTVSLTPKQVERLEEAVASGGYASSSEVVREALRLWERREALRQAEIARLEAAYEDGIASGPAVAMTREQFHAAIEAVDEPVA